MSKAGSDEKGIDGYLFRLIATFEAAAMQQMGKIANPMSGDVEVSLEGARDAIEMLDTLKRKTAGNLNGNEERLLEHILYQLRMNYVEVAEAERSRAGGEGRPEEGRSEDAPGERTAAANGPAEETGDGSATGDGRPTGHESGENGGDEGSDDRGDGGDGDARKDEG